MTTPMEILSDVEFIRELKLQKAMEIVPEIRERNERLEKIAVMLARCAPTY